MTACWSTHKLLLIYKGKAAFLWSFALHQQPRAQQRHIAVGSPTAKFQCCTAAADGCECFIGGAAVLRAPSKASMAANCFARWRPTPTPS